MKLILAFFFSLLTLNSSAQCTECSSFSEAIKNPAIVKSIIINPLIKGGRLDSIPSFIDRFTNLQILYLTDHNISSIPDQIASLTKLKELSFGGCKLKSVPEAIFSLKNLKELILVDNSFTEDYKTKLAERIKKELPLTQLML